jgi:hypothetical protein
MYQNNFQVYIRVKPGGPHQPTAKRPFRIIDDTIFVRDLYVSTEHQYTFTRIFDEDSSNFDVYGTIL